MTSIEISLAVLTVTIAGATVYFTEAAHKLAVKKHQDDLELAKKKREDDLFDRRYEVFEKISAIWIYLLKVEKGIPVNEPPQFNLDEAASLVFKAGFLFDKEIVGVVERTFQRLITAPYKPDPKDTIGDFPRDLFGKYLNIK